MEVLPSGFFISTASRGPRMGSFGCSLQAENKRTVKANKRLCLMFISIGKVMLQRYIPLKIKCNVWVIKCSFATDKFFTLFLHQPEEVLLSCRLIGNRV